jgi:hypothetical protein
MFRLKLCRSWVAQALACAARRRPRLCGARRVRGCRRMSRLSASPSIPAQSAFLCDNLDPFNMYFPLVSSRRDGVTGVSSVCAASLILVAVNLAAQAPAAPQLEPVELHARLLSPMTTRLTRKGDMVSAQILAAGRLQGGILEGDVSDVHGAGASGKQASIQFQFHTLHLSGSAVPVSARLLGLASSKGRKDVDDDGLSIAIDQRAEHGGGLSSVASALHIAGGKQGSGSIRISTTAASLSLATGSEFVLHIEAKQP